MSAADLLTKLHLIEEEIQYTLYKMDKKYKSGFGSWVQNPKHLTSVARYLDSMICDYDSTRQIAVIRFCTRQYTVKQTARLLAQISRKIDIMKLIRGLTILWHRDRKKELLVYLESIPE
eukprot:NODE_14_length_51535_cov_1.125049.p45 type:complete len:119 gc:universal NODE_14_length_51535_cov_1.125049:14945-14589(-)